MDLESRTDHASDQTDSLWTGKRKALYQQASEGLRQSHERYIATTRPVLERKFQQEYPDLTDTEIETLVNEALAKGYRHEAKACPPGGWPSSPNCY
jgi:hypothetical protein